MGVVYRARHAMMRRPTAVKLLRPEKAGESSLRRFEREVQLTARLTHPNTITIFDYGRTPDGVFYYAMELLDGAALDAIVSLGGPLTPARTVHLLIGVAGALTEAHGIGLIHRDIKPANIILCRQGGMHDVPKVVDFGLVKDLETDAGVTRDGIVTGTPLYMSPEAINAPNEMGPRSDLYSLGAVAYFALTGEHVFSGRTTVEVCAHHLHSEPAPPSQRAPGGVPADLERVVLDCLAKNPDDRPPSAAALRSRLEACECAGGWSAQAALEWWSEFGEDLAVVAAETTAVPGTLVRRLSTP
jgi:serine/threonine-protein kinase